MLLNDSFQWLHEIGKGLEPGLGFLHFKYEETETQTSKPLYEALRWNSDKSGAGLIVLSAKLLPLGLGPLDSYVFQIMDYLS